MRSCLAEESLLGGGIVHSNRGAPAVSSAIGILCTVSSRTAEVLIAMEPVPSKLPLSLLKARFQGPPAFQSAGGPPVISWLALPIHSRSRQSSGHSAPLHLHMCPRSLTSPARD